MLFLTAGDANLHFAPGIFPVHREGDNGIAFAIYTAIERVQLALVEQQLTVTGRVADDVAGGDAQRRKVGPERARLLSAMVAEPGLCAFFFVISIVNRR